jgi:hypothetical protein
VNSGDPLNPDAQARDPNYKHSRAGWCPGDVVRTWDLPLGELPPGDYEVEYAPEPYVNQCSPEFAAQFPDLFDDPAFVARHCVLDTGAAYDGGRHTPPRFQVSGLLSFHQG